VWLVSPVWLRVHRRDEILKMNRIQELRQEFQTVLAGRNRITDTLIPPIVFLLLNATTRFEIALYGSLGIALLISVFRALKRQPLMYAFGGVGSVLLAVLVARLSGQAAGYFLPGLFSGVVTVLLSLLSVLIKRPLVAWTSALARRWPLDWYWHPRVRPAYSEVTLAWGFFFALRLALQLVIYQRGTTEALGLTQLLTGWPATILLLVFTYLYGIRRLGQLKGPSVEQFKEGVEPPWQGQQRGF
jgi:hypothetical protein